MEMAEDSTLSRGFVGLCSLPVLQSFNRLGYKSLNLNPKPFKFNVRCTRVNKSSRVCNSALLGLVYTASGIPAIAHHL